MTQAEGLYIGLISGTSADGIDAALVRFGADESVSMVASHAHPWPEALRTRLIALGQGGPLNSLEEYGTLDIQVGEQFADAALTLLRGANVDIKDVRAIGSHGQTIRHRPYGAAGDGKFPFTLQIGDGNLVAERTGITTVSDFRRRDVAAGGHGAPLLPALHQALLHSATENRVVLNLGGIANITLLPAKGEVRGFDTGPANALMDAWCSQHTGVAFDAGGKWGATGEINEALLARLLSDPWFKAPPPKSSGREQFHLEWVKSHLQDDLRPEDVQATLLALTVQTVADAIAATQPDTARLLVCGGGVHNASLMSALQKTMDKTKVESTAAHGLDPDQVEAMGFAWLARQTLLGLPGNLPSVSGAKGYRVLGTVAFA
ncbi:anhydro-N-acetylmuramic acid kinase [Lysobacter sp. HDW10]|uniref:anhydro-N-acetylmuramic acid kinase n=1 Tax=Lysobacter sp. HDW10 TaxID=2714936 RepID=UPI00140C1EE4|nr:anhydro-N-acetylmuramic acid kinase [Lysobacter sp. HDW10]QIK80893.1 anhydro-N-acetylmuramic acid kinase [Lysobacter sp. HDW10]